MRNGQASSASGLDNGQIAREIARISGLDLASVRALWRTTFKKDPPSALTRDLLVGQLACRIQEKVFGGHDAVPRAMPRTSMRSREQRTRQRQQPARWLPKIEAAQNDR